MPTLEKMREWWRDPVGDPPTKDAPPAPREKRHDNGCVVKQHDGFVEVKMPKVDAVDMDKMRKAMPESIRAPGFNYYTASKDGKDALLNFGKYKGLEVSEVARRDLSYLNWIVERCFSVASGEGGMKHVATFPLALGEICRDQIIAHGGDDPFEVFGAKLFEAKPDLSDLYSAEYD